jgi:hypothetical protein
MGFAAIGMATPEPVRQVPLMSPFKPKPLNKKQRNEWDELNVTIRECGGRTTTKPQEYPIQFECDPKSRLPNALGATYEIVGIGIEEKLWPFVEVIMENGTQKRTITHVRPTAVAVWELRLPPSPLNDGTIR